MTLSGERIANGNSSNSMYEDNTVRGMVTEEDMRKYYAKESGISRNKVKPNAMKVVKFSEIDLNQLSPVNVK